MQLLKTSCMKKRTMNPFFWTPDKISQSVLWTFITGLKTLVLLNPISYTLITFVIRLLLRHFCSTIDWLINLLISIQYLGQFWQEPEPSQATGMALARCILGKLLGVVCNCFSLSLDFPTFTDRCLHVPNNASPPSSEKWNWGREWCPVI
jgi:hypothetical protein